MDGQGDALQTHRHRIPLGLLMLQQGWISHDQLRLALEAQRASGSGRVGQWLVHQRSVSEEMVTKALGLQWNCPVLTPELQESNPLSVTLPRLFLDAFEALPLRLAAGKVLYLGFEERLDPVLALALERMGGVRVECAIVRESSFRPAHRRMLASSFPSVELVEAASGTAAAHALARALERSHPVAARLVRVHDCLWLRTWSRVQRAALPEAETIHDVLCSIGPVR
jgi:hypothetical protein